LIFEEQVQEKKCSLFKNSEEENHFINELINYIKNTNTESILNVKALEAIV